MRILLSIFLSFCVCTGIFFGMHLMTSTDTNLSNENQEVRHLVFLRDENETDMEIRKRVKPEKPPKQEQIEKIKIHTTQKPQTSQKTTVEPFNVNISKNLNISSISSLSGAKIATNIGPIDANSLQAVRRINPEYPRRARLAKKEGYVDLVFDISPEGNVSNIKVVDSNPVGVFERAATKAMAKWKFKKHETSRTASIKLVFRLDR